jgi:hypothetical protein
MPREPDPINDPELFAVLDLGGVSSPGTVTLSGHDDVVEWDVKAAEGQKGASLTRKGTKPPSFKASIYMATEEQIGQWPAFRDAVNATVKGKTTTAVDVYHPDLAAQGITSVVKGTIGGTTYDGKGGQTIVVTFQVYAPPVASGGSPSGSKNGKNDPNAAANAELAALTKQYQATPWG